MPNSWKPKTGRLLDPNEWSPQTGRLFIESEPTPEWEVQEFERERWLHEKMQSGEIEAVSPSFWRRFKEDIPQMAGGTVGGLVGAKIGATAGLKIPASHPHLKGAAVVAGAVGGAFFGGMGGKGYQQYYRMTRPGAKPMTLGEIYNEQIIAGIEEGASELIGRGIVAGGGKLLAPVKKRLIPGAKGLSKQLLKRGAHLTPAQMTESRIIDTIEGMAEKSFLGGGKLQRLKRVIQPRAFSQYIDDIVEQISRGAKSQLSPDEVGDLLLDAISGKRTAFKAATKAAYGKVDKLSKGTKVSLKPLKAFARKQMKEAAMRKGIGSSEAGDTLLKKVLKLDDTVSFRQAHALRSALMDEQRAMSLTKDKAIGLTKRFVGITDDAMESSAKKLKSKEVLSAWRDANIFYKHGGAIKGDVIPGITEFDTKLIRSLTKTLSENPEVAIKKIFRPGASKQIRLVRKFMDKNQWKTLKTAYLENLLRESANADGVVLGKTFLGKLNKMGDDTLKTIYSGQELASIRSIGRLGELLQAPTGGSGGMLVQLMQAGAVLNLGRMVVGGEKVLGGESVAIVIGPPALSRMLANPTWSKWLSTGFRTPRGTAAATTLGTRIIRVVTDIQFEINKEKEYEPRWPTTEELRGYGGRGF